MRARKNAVVRGGDARRVELNRRRAIRAMPHGRPVTRRRQRVVVRSLCLRGRALRRHPIIIAREVRREPGGMKGLKKRIRSGGGSGDAIAAISPLIATASCGRMPRASSDYRVASSATPRSCRRHGAPPATRDSWDLHLAVNLRAPFVLIQNLAPAPVSMTGSSSVCWTSGYGRLTPYV